MSLFDNLFDNEHRQRYDINSLSVTAASNDRHIDGLIQDLQDEKQKTALLHKKLDRMELVVEGLIRTLEAKELIAIDALKSVMLSLDSLDGEADGRMAESTPRRLS